MVCKKCAHESYCDMAQFGGHIPPITACSKFKEKSQTNADKIRSMTDEELATFLFHAWNNASWCSAKVCPNEDSCLPCWLEWIKKECE